MADSQDKLTPEDAKKLAELEAQISKDKTSTAKQNKPASSASDSAKSAANTNKSMSQSPATKTNSNSRASANANKDSSNWILWLFTVVNTLILVAIVAAGYWGWTQWQDYTQEQQAQLAAQESSIQAQQAKISQSIGASQSTEQNLRQQNQGLQSSIQSLLEQVQVNAAQVRTNQQNLADVSGRRPSDWLLAEADYLVRMAGRKLWLENDVNTAMMMLESADSRLQDLNDPSLLPIREKLANDIQGLQQVNPVSIDSIALQVGALVKQVSSLPLAFFKKPESAQTENNSQQANDWRSNLARNWQQVTQNFFSVKRKTAEIKPFMSNQEQWLSKQQLSLALLQAQAAVLRENQALYRQALDTALLVSQEYFDLKQASVQQFVQNLAELQNTEINKVYPEQFSAAPLLQDTIEIRLDNRFRSAPQLPTEIAPTEENTSEVTESVEPETEASQL